MSSYNKRLRVGDHGQHITSSGVIRARVGCTGVDVEAHSGAKMRTRVPLQYLLVAGTIHLLHGTIHLLIRIDVAVDRGIVHIIFRSKFIVVASVILLPPAVDQGKCISSKILSRLRRSCIWVEVGECSPEAMETLPKWEFLF